MKNSNKPIALAVPYWQILAESLLLTALLCLTLLHSGPLRAQSDAYSTEVAVANRGGEEQQNAYRTAFRRILLDNSGDKTLLNRDAVRSAMQRAEQYVANYSYRTPPPGTLIASDTPTTDLVRETGEATHLMLVSFDRLLVRQLIDSPQGAKTQKDDPEAIVPVTQRTASALVWLLIRDTGRDIMISDPAAANVQARAREIAGATGVSLVFPVGDDTDHQALTVDDLSSLNLERVMAASERYAQSTVLVGALSRDGSRGWQGQWIRLQGAEPQEAQFNSSSLDEGLKNGLSLLGSNGIPDQSYRYGGGAAAATEALVWVGAVNTLNSYAAVQNFFETVPSVATVYPKEIRNNAWIFAVIPRSALRDIESAVSTQDWLRSTNPPLNSGFRDLARNADLAIELGQ